MSMPTSTHTKGKKSVSSVYAANGTMQGLSTPELKGASLSLTNGNLKKFEELHNAAGPSTNVQPNAELHEEFHLLDPTPSDHPSGAAANVLSAHESITAPILTRDALEATGLSSSKNAQYGVLGKLLAINTKDRSFVPEDPRLYINTNAPLSALVCGVQGSGKSHTVSAMLESMLIPGDRRIGALSKRLTGCVFHFGEGGKDANPCEAAWLANGIEPGKTNVPTVRVFVSPSSLQTMRTVYAKVGKHVSVEPLYFSEDELDAQAFLSMMAVGSSDSAPLYVQIILTILRELGENYRYTTFKASLEEKKRDFNPAQKAGLNQRLALLESFLDPAAKRMTTTSAFRMPQQAKAAATSNRLFSTETLTIIDLSDPFIDPGSACGLFEIVLRLFIKAPVNTGKLVLLDEAHKYLSPTDSPTGLTKTLLTLIREQRHKAMRVIISTQEPTTVPSILIDLCSLVVMHRFSSPAWWDHIIRHVSADLSSSDVFNRVVKLQTGEAIVLAPSGLCLFQAAVPTGGTTARVGQVGRRYMHVKVRRRITVDGGASILAV